MGLLEHQATNLAANRKLGIDMGAMCLHSTNGAVDVLA